MLSNTSQKVIVVALMLLLNGQEFYNLISAGKGSGNTQVAELHRFGCPYALRLKRPAFGCSHCFLMLTPFILVKTITPRDLLHSLLGIGNNPVLSNVHWIKGSRPFFWLLRLINFYRRRLVLASVLQHCYIPASARTNRPEQTHEIESGLSLIQSTTRRLLL